LGQVFFHPGRFKEHTGRFKEHTGRFKEHTGRFKEHTGRFKEHLNGPPSVLDKKFESSNQGSSSALDEEQTNDNTTQSKVVH
jgi:hypothetical protein